MGSAGGSYFSGDLTPLIERLRQSERGTKHEEFEAEIAGVLSAMLAQYNDRDTEAVVTHLDEIKRALEKEIDGTIDLRFGGSVAKHTYVDGLSDIDSLVMLDSCELADESPAAAKTYLAQRLAERFPNTDVREGTLAVTVSFSDAEIQLLPAVSCNRHVMIASPDGAGWARIRPKEFSQVLSRTNEENAGKVVPTIKLAKAIVANLPSSQQLSGYHIESLAVDAFRGYSGATNLKAMLSHFFAHASERVLTPVVDRTGQSVHVDEYLGPPLSGSRLAAADALKRVVRRMRVADAGDSVDSWRALFGE